MKDYREYVYLSNHYADSSLDVYLFLMMFYVLFISYGIFKVHI